ncbi:LamG domain-containing protein [Peribacillus sp. TH27]|nr:LamG domain-containing protein [Peribacillus sp. TH27]
MRGGINVIKEDKKIQNHDILKIVGYADKISVKPGENIDFKISTTSSNYSTSIVRLCGGITNSEIADLPIEIIDADCNGTYNGRLQTINAGSYAKLPLPESIFENGEFTVLMWVYATSPMLNREQILWSSQSINYNGARLFIDKAGHLSFAIKNDKNQSYQVKSDKSLEEKTWYLVAATYSIRDQKIGLYRRRCSGWTMEDKEQHITLVTDVDITNVRVSNTFLAAEQNPQLDGENHLHFNGKIENPKFIKIALNASQLQDVYSGKKIEEINNNFIANYDFGLEIASDKLIDKSSNAYHGAIYHTPTRAVTSHSWTGKKLDFKLSPDQYAAIHFHEDDIEDANWDTDVSWELPLGLKSGAYALKLEADGDIDYIPFFVRPYETSKKSKILFLVPTNTYLAYANERLFNLPLDAFMDHELELAKQDRYLIAHPEFGKSIYDTHTDGSGVHYSSRLRPIMNLRPHYRNWLNGFIRHLAADLYISGWLEKRGHQYDIATDEDLDKLGVDLLDQYQVLITGSHPEYWTRPMLEALQHFQSNGGRLMYMGGNGFYWVTSIDPKRPHLVEVRRGNSGTRSWDSPPGEVFHSTTGECGGLWRHNGYIPQSLVGIGLAAMGWGKCCGYRLLPDSKDERAKFIFEGIKDDEIIGDFGYIMGGAVGDEVDRYDLSLGTPKHALRLATATGLDNNYQLVHEDLLFTAPGQGGSENELVRADMTYFEIEGGGAVFSVGSINWAGSMAWNNYDNNVAKISDNVLNRFLFED